MRMQLYKMELYKIFHRKIFWIGILAILGLMFVYFWFAEVGDERCVIDGRSYSGYEAVQMNKKITEEYVGTVTDEKINQIVDKYGLPSELNLLRKVNNYFYLFYFLSQNIFAYHK